MSKISNKIIWIFLLILSISTVNVYAKDNCDKNAIKIKSITSDNIEGVVELSKPSYEDNFINLDIQMKEVGDNIIYEAVIKNTSDEDYYLNDNSIQLNSSYFDCEIISDDKLTIIKPNQERKVKIKISYKKEVEEDKFKDNKYEDNQAIILKFEDKSQDLLSNPLTKNNLIRIVITLFLITGITIYTIKNKKTKYIVLIGITLIPLSINALCKVELNINTHIVINKGNPCTYDGELTPGVEFTKGNFTYHYMQEFYYTYTQPYLPVHAPNPDYIINPVGSPYVEVKKWTTISDDGWGVRYTPGVENTTENNRMCTEINNKPIVSLSYMFAGIQADENLKIDLMDTSRVKDMKGTFSYTNITPSNLSNFSTINTENMSSMFHSNSATSLDLSSFDTSNVTNMSHMFYTSKATTLDLSSFDTSNVIDMSYMFLESQVTSLDLSSFDTGNVTNMKSMFYNSKATTLDLSSFDTSKVTDMSYMFSGSQVTSLDLSSFDTGNVTDMSGMFSRSQVTTLDLSSFDTGNVTNMKSMFDNSKATTLDLSSFDTSNVIDMSYMFSGSQVTSLDLSSFDTSKVTNLSNMFYNSKATILDLSSFDTSNVTDMSYMFSGSQVTTLDLSSFDTGNVTNMKSMFDNSKATTLDLSSFDTSNVTNMSHMFYNSKATTGYARTQADADKFNNSNDTWKPSSLTFIVKG